jgi:hypothetical protein
MQIPLALWGKALAARTITVLLFFVFCSSWCLVLLEKNRSSSLAYPVEEYIASQSSSLNLGFAQLHFNANARCGKRQERL